MKSFNQFVVESYTARENIQEALPLLIPAAMKLGSMALGCLLYTSPSPRDRQKSRMPSSA